MQGYLDKAKNCGCFVERVDSDADTREANTDLRSHLWLRIFLNPFHVLVWEAIISHSMNTMDSVVCIRESG